MKKIILTLWCAISALAIFAQNSAMSQKSTEPQVLFKTSLGDIVIKLYNDTPAHRDNMLKLVKEGYYDGVLFHRVIKDFMVQAGDPDSKNAASATPLGSGDPGYTLPAEIIYPAHFHKYGAVAAARTGDSMNPERRSSGSQFYIVTGNKYTPAQLAQMEQRMNIQARQQYFMRLQKENIDKIRSLNQAGDTAALESLRKELIAATEAAVKDVRIPAEVAQAYTTVGGTPHLDDAYTVYGEVVRGMDIVEKIQNQPTGNHDRPVEDIRIVSAAVVKE